MKDRILNSIMYFFLFFGTCALCACGNDGNSESPIFLKDCGPTSAQVYRVIDGDTIELDSGEKVRYLLVNTPEVGECHYQEAKDFNIEQVLGKTVEIEYDLTCTDRYGRLLGYVTSEEGSINELLLVRGHARLLYIPSNGDEYLDEYKGLEWYAKENNIGLWRYCE